MKPIDVDEFFNRSVIILELEYNLNDGDTIYTSVVAAGETEA